MPLRLLHAADVLLDTPLQGIGPVPRDAIDLVAQATLIAWERAVEAASTHDVDALLLTGNTFAAAEGSLAADVALRQGCERLAEAQIPVFVVPGPLDPVAAWDELPKLPENVTVFRSLREEPVELTDRGRTLALIQPVGPWSESLANGSKQPAASRPFSVGLWWEGGDGSPTQPPVNLLAPLVDVVCCREEALTTGWLKPETQVQRQSSPQGMTSAQTGPKGVTLIEVDPQRRFTCRLLPLAPVRRERLRVRLDGVRHRDDLCDQMLVELEELPAIPGEQLRLIDWEFSGSPSTSDRCAWTEESLQEAVDTLNQLTDQPGRLRYLHQLTPLWQVRDDSEPANDLWRDYLDMLEQRSSLNRAEIERLLTESRPDLSAKGVWERGLQHVDPRQVWERARRYGRRWFASV
uniref:Calcineurin-like phosphoesterase domain-containing protein n=1 Tax=Schlesneria paludicola TaxID=360056 RepID=A0A7C4QRE8_9PLAN